MNSLARRSRFAGLCGCLWLATVLSGCGGSNVFVEKEHAAQQAAKDRIQREKKRAESLQRQQRKLEEEALRDVNIEREFQRTQAEIRGSSNLDAPAGSYRGDTTASRAVLQQIRDAVQLDRTLVVWIIDTSPSALRVTDELRRAAVDYYNGGELKAVQTAQPEQLVSAVIGFDEKTNVVLDAPTADSTAVRAALEQLTSTTEGKEATFATLQHAVTRYAPLQAEQRRRMIVVLATDEAGSDAHLAEQIVPILRKNEIPVYVLAVDSPWGTANPYAADLPPEKQAELPNYGPESVMPERVLIQMPVGSYRYGISAEQIDSGFGPFALEWVARAGGGTFLAARVSGGASYGGGSVWPSGSEQHFDPHVMKKYAPDYISPTEYKQMLAANKACQALVDAAQLPRAAVLTQPTTTFVRRNEADLKKQIMNAQRDAARVAPQLEQLVDVLSAGEKDREKLTSPRWQAGYDLALGRALAARVRAEGYNAMLAALGRGKNFENPDSNTWYLEPSDTIDAGSLYQKMADKAREVLQRVVKEHPNTPWGKEAEEDLKTPMGWAWREG